MVLPFISDYDPSEAMNLPGMPFPPQNMPRNNRAGRRGRGNKKGGSRAPFSAEGPVHDRSKSTIVVERIPEENFSEDQVREFFDQFGTIESVSMQPYKHLAIVKYDGWNAANAAYQSTKAIFDNRFVKVFWYKDEPDKPAGRPGGGKFANGGEAEDETMQTEPEMDPEEFQRRQEEAQKQHQEREAKRSELELKRQELEKQQHDLLAKHRQETERLQAKLAAKSTDNSTDADGASGSGSNGTGTEMLRAKLALLEQEAKILGIDPNAAAEDDTGDAAAGASAGGFRGGGYRGRGGAGYRGRGGRGSFRGNGARHAAYAQYSIDNRPKKVAISGVDFTAPDKDEALRHFLLVRF